LYVIILDEARKVLGEINCEINEELLEGPEKLNSVIPGVSNDETLLYAPEIKFSATQIKTTGDPETKIKGMYVASTLRDLCKYLAC